MYIKSPDRNLIPRSFSSKKTKLLFFLSLIILYTGLVFLIGGAAYKDGIFGKIIKPIITENIRIPINYLKSLRAKPAQIFIDIKHKDFQKLAYKREVALSRGVLLSTPDDKVSARVKWNDKNVKVDMRLKGDLEDHWADSSKWSFRVETKGDETILGMKEFSLQHPNTRGFLNDWYLHQFLKKLGGFPVLRFYYVNVTVNGKDLGIYNMEEHFDDMLLKNNNYIVAPIIRIYDHLLWYNVDPEVGFTQSHLNEQYTLSPIDAFNTGKINRDDELLMNFNQAKNLLESFRQGKLLTHQVFEIEKLAKLFALIDLFGFRHTTAYSNIRFYYNPIASRLEPIGYDNTFIFEATAIEGQNRRLGILPLDKPSYVSYDEYQIWYETFFSDIIFYKEYIKALEDISNKQFLDEFFSSIKEEEQDALNLLHKTFPGYRFKNKPILYKNQEYIRNLLNPKQGMYAYFNEYNSDQSTFILELGNIQSLPIEIITATSGEYEFESKVENIILQPKSPYKFVDYKKVEFILPEGLLWNRELKEKLKVKYRILGTNHEKDVTVFTWSSLDDGFLKNDFVRQKPNYYKFDFVNVDESNGIILIKQGDWNVNESIIIPKGFRVICEKATTLNLLNNAMILSYSPLEFIGGPNSPITIKSDDHTGQGIVVIDADKKSFFKSVVFENLNSPERSDWKLSSALTFYESPLAAYNCLIKDIKGRDAITAIRSEINIDRIDFLNIKGTALNSIYCRGDVLNLSCKNCISGGVKVIGSVINMSNILINKSDGRAVKVEESSNVKIKNLTIEGCNIAVECNDMSFLDIEKTRITKCEKGICLLQKPTRIGPPKVTVRELEINGNKDDYLIDEDSILSIEGNIIKPNQKSLYESLYKNM